MDSAAPDATTTTTEGAGGREAFESQEYDSTGRYVARNVRSKPDQWHKRKLRYEVLLSRSDTPARSPLEAKQTMPTINSSTIDIRVEHGVPVSVALKEQVETAIMGSTKLDSRTSLDLKLIAKQEAAKAPDWAGARVPLAAREPYVDAPKLATLDAVRIDGRSFTDVLAELEGVAKDYDAAALVENPKDPVSQEDKKRNSEQALVRNRAFAALNALIRSRSEVVKDVVEKVYAGSPAARWLISGLASSGSAPAQEALVGLIRDRKLDKKLRESAALSLLQANQPTTATGKSVEAMLTDPEWRHLALFGVGTLARRLRDAGEVEEGERLAAVLAQELVKAKDLDTQRDALFGLANAADPKVLSTIRPYLTHAQAALRAGAVTSLRLIQDPRVEPLIIARLSGDDAREVRIAALDSAGKRDPASDKLVQAVESAASADADVRVRLAAVRVLGKWLPNRPALRMLLQRISEQDEDPNVLLLAKAALAAQTG